MRGQDKIIEMRKNHLVPEIVFLNDFECNTDWFEKNDHATVSLSNKDVPQMLDLRFLVGLTVSISGSTEKRAKDLFEMVKKAGARTVAACHVIPVNQYRAEAGWGEIWHG